MKQKLQMIVMLLISVCLLGACDTFRDDISPDSYSEAPKYLDGTWQLTSASRNGSDISSTMNFSQFHLILNTDSTYTLENYMPFVVDNSGTWAVDDIYYPFFLTFQEDGEGAVQVEISYPIVQGKRRITMTVNPGCSSNSYVYSFEKIDNN